MNKEKEGGFMVTAPALPGCITQGDDIDDAIELNIGELKSRGENIPDDSNTLEYSINLATA